MYTNLIGSWRGVRNRYRIEVDLRLIALVMIAVISISNTGSEGRRLLPLKFTKYFTDELLEPTSRHRVGRVGSGVSQCVSICGSKLTECVAFRLIKSRQGEWDCLLYKSLGYSRLTKRSPAFGSAHVYLTRAINYIGCFVDISGDRDLTIQEFPSNNSAEVCIRMCQVKGGDGRNKWIGLVESSGVWRWDGLTKGVVSTTNPGWAGYGNPDGKRAEDDGAGTVYPGKGHGYRDLLPTITIGYFCERY